MDKPDDDEYVPSVSDLEPEARRTLNYLGLGVLLVGLLVYLVLAFLYQPRDGLIILLTITGIVFVAVLLHRLQTIQFSLKTALIAILTLQIPMGLLLTAKSNLQWGLGIVLALLWGAGFVTYVMVTPKPAIK